MASSFRFTAWQSAYLTAITKKVQSHLESTLGWDKNDGFDIQILASEIETDGVHASDGDCVSGTFKGLIIQFHPRNDSVEMSVGRSALEGDLLVLRRKTKFGFTYYDVVIIALREGDEVVG